MPVKPTAWAAAGAPQKPALPRRPCCRSWTVVGGRIRFDDLLPQGTTQAALTAGIILTRDPEGEHGHDAKADLSGLRRP